MRAKPGNLRKVSTTNSSFLSTERHSWYILGFGVLFGPAGETPMLIIDCHAHIYGEDEKKYPPIDKPYRPPAGTGTLAHLRREMRNAGVKLVTAVHTSTFYRWDNRFTADSARKNRDWMARICTLDPDDGHSPGLLEQYVRKDNVRGMRSIPA